MLRRFSLAAIALGLLILISGCGKNNSTAPQTSGSSASSPGPTNSTAVASTQSSEARLLAIQNLLKRQDLVLAVGDLQAGGPPAFALELSQSSADAFSGKAWLDDSPPHIYSANAVIQRDSSTGAARVLLILTPPGQAANVQTGTMQMALTVAGDARNLEISTRLQASGTGAISTLLLDSDPKMHKEIVARFDAEVGRLAGIQTPIANLLKNFAVLDGQAQSSNSSEPLGDTETVVLARDASQQFVWHGEEKTISKKTGHAEAFPVVALVAVAQDKPFLVIRGPARQTVLSLAADGKFTGAWNGGPGSVPRPAQFTLTTALDEKGRDDLFAEQKTALLKIASDTPFLGLTGDPSSASNPTYPISFAISVSADGGVIGQAFLPLTSISMSISGKVVDTQLGPRITLQNPASPTTQPTTRNSQDFNEVMKYGDWTLGIPAGSTGTTKLSGTCAWGDSQSIVELDQFTDAARADFKKSLTASLADGMQFKARLPDLATASDSIVEFKLNPTDNSITGKVVSGGSHFGLLAGDTLSGELKDQNGWMEMALTAHDPAATNPDLTTTALLFPYEGSIYLNGANFSPGAGGSSAPLARFDGFQVKQ